MNVATLNNRLNSTTNARRRRELHDAISNAQDTALRARAMSLSDDCGANAPGGGGFQPGNKCAGGGRVKVLEDRAETNKSKVKEADKRHRELQNQSDIARSKDKESEESKALLKKANAAYEEYAALSEQERQDAFEAKIIANAPPMKAVPQIEIADGVDVDPEFAIALLSLRMHKTFTDQSEHFANRFKFKLVSAEKKYDDVRYRFEVTSLVPPSPAPANAIDEIPDREGFVYRGMSKEEWDSSVAAGKLQSAGDYNINQGGFTFYGSAPTAENYAYGFAPEAYATTPSKPSVVVEIPRKFVMSHEDLPDKIPEMEYAHTGSVGIENVTNVYTLHPEGFRDGHFDLIVENGKPRLSSANNASGNKVKIIKQDPSMKFADDCGANGPGGHGFQPGNTCAADGAGGGGVATKKPRASKAKTTKAKTTKAKTTKAKTTAKPRAKAKPKNAGVDMSNKTAYKQTKSPNFKKWFKKSEVAEPGSLAPRGAFHGTQRPDRVGNIFDPKRATSGPMPFFTESAELASAYSERKRDTSLETPTSYAEWFKIKTDKGEFNVDDAWRNLSSAERVRLTNVIPHVTNADENGDTTSTYRLGNSTEYGLSGKDHWDYMLKEHRGNALAAARDVWLDSGALFDSEAEFMDVLKVAGVKGASFHDPNALHSGVFKVYLSIQKALHTDMIPGVVYDRLVENGKGRPALIDPNEAADPWDKRAITGDEWVEKLIQDGADKTNFAWTTIPDWVTDTLRKFGYDGIRDFSGKYAKPDPNVESSHVVWIPFDSWQVKSAIGNNGQWSRTNPDMSMSDDQCGANAKGGGGFTKGNTCAAGSGKNKKIPGFDVLQKQIESPEFKKFFKESKASDHIGPTMLYHGTHSKNPFDTFDMFKAEIGAHFGTEDIANGFGLGYDPDWLLQQTAEDQKILSKEGSRVIPVWLSIQNPLRMIDQGTWDLGYIAKTMLENGSVTQKQVDEWDAAHQAEWKSHWGPEKKNVGPFDRNASAHKLLEIGGYDGIRYINRREGRIPKAVREMGSREKNEMTDAEFLKVAPQATESWIALYPEQIKSAIGNNGDFDTKKKNMSMSAAPSREGANPWHWNSKPDVNEIGPVRVVQNPLTFQYTTSNDQEMPSAGELNRVTRQYRNAQKWANKQGKKLFLKAGRSKWRDYLVSKGWLRGDGELKIDVAMALSGASDLAEAAARVVPPVSKEQAEAGNYKKGHVTVDGLPVTIETAAGQKRFGWDQKMTHHYGYIKRTESEADGDHIDVFVNADYEWDSDPDFVYIVDQLNESGDFDEHKCMVGFENKDDAEKAYVENYEKGWDRYTAVTPISVDKFKTWIHDGDTSKPYAPAMKLSDDCGANAQGGGGFQPGNTCAAEDGTSASAPASAGKMTVDDFNAHIKTIKSVPELYKCSSASRRTEFLRLRAGDERLAHGTRAEVQRRHDAGRALARYVHDAPDARASDAHGPYRREWREVTRELSSRHGGAYRTPRGQPGDVGSAHSRARWCTRQVIRRTRRKSS